MHSHFSEFNHHAGIACLAGVEKGRGIGDREEGRKGKRGGGLGRGGGDACSKNPLLFISADAGVRKFLID